MKKRLVSQKYISKAYTTDIQNEDINLEAESIEEKIDKLPKEVFQILGEVISFIENTNKLEGDKNEN